jgi:hypothetical protein
MQLWQRLSPLAQSIELQSDVLFAKDALCVTIMAEAVADISITGQAKAVLLR